MHCRSCVGEKFDQLMLRFTTYVLKVVCLREAKGEGRL